MKTRLLAAALIACLCSGAVQAGSLFDDLGGHDGLVRLVDSTLDRIRRDPRIKASFEETSIPRLKRLLVEQLCAVADGGCTYTGRDIRKSHAELGLRSRDFNAMTEDLQDAMDAQGIPNAVQFRLIARLAPMHRDVVTR